MLFFCCCFFWVFFLTYHKGAIKLTQDFLLHLSGRDPFWVQLGKPISFWLFYSQGTNSWWNPLTSRAILLWKQWPTTLTCELILALGSQLSPVPPHHHHHHPPPHSWPCSVPWQRPSTSLALTTINGLTFHTLNYLSGIGKTDQNGKITSYLVPQLIYVERCAVWDNGWLISEL